MVQRYPDSIPRALAEPEFWVRGLERNIFALRNIKYMITRSSFLKEGRYPLSLLVLHQLGLYLIGLYLIGLWVIVVVIIPHKIIILPLEIITMLQRIILTILLHTILIIAALILIDKWVIPMTITLLHGIIDKWVIPIIIIPLEAAILHEGCSLKVTQVEAMIPLSR